MIYMLCRNRVADFSVWKAVFDSCADRHPEAGLTLVNMWQCVDDPNNVFFLFEIESIDRAKEFMAAPEAAEAGRVSGVIDGEYHFVEDPEEPRGVTSGPEPTKDEQ